MKIRGCGGIEKMRQSIGDEDEITDAEPGLGEEQHEVDGESPDGTADGETQIAERCDIRETHIGFEPSAGANEEHHAVVGKTSDGEQHQEADDPSRPFETVRQTQNAGADDGDEDVSECLWLGRQRLVLGEERRFSR